MDNMGGDMKEMKGTYIVCAYRPWNIKLFKEKISKLSYKFILISNKNELALDFIRSINPDVIFFLDWSWIVPTEIIKSYKCVGFHAAPLPEFRGGSPIQNQIIRGIKNTKLSAFLMDEGIDTGDILIQEDLSLEGHLDNIFSKISELIYRMIQKIIQGEYTIKKQEGKGSYFKRRKPEESELKVDSFNKPMEFIYDFTRMLEDPYPNAFVRLGNKKIIFKRTEFDSVKNKIYAKVEIIEDEGTNE